MMWTSNQTTAFFIDQQQMGLKANAMLFEKMQKLEPQDHCQ